VELAINWSMGSELIDGWKTPNLYGLLFVSGLIGGYFVVRRMYRKEGVNEELLDKLVLYMVLATIVGARLGHVLFYGPYFDEFTSSGICN
jgi:phosphatidylglycerol:prolipoprotein diacylglycerol transferase